MSRIIYGLDEHSTEQVTRWHPDKACDQISDAILTEYLKADPNAHCGIETLWKGDSVILAGEISSYAKIGKNERAGIVQRVGKDLGYEVNRIEDLITSQSVEIKQAVDSEKNIGAGDQGMMYGYACRNTDSRLPYGFDVANRIIDIITDDVLRNNLLLGDAKTQVTTKRNSKGDEELDGILVSACHIPFVPVEEVRNHIAEILNKYLDVDCEGIPLLVNPAGAWSYGGPKADCGITGRKIVCDQYGGYCPVGGGAFSGKDPTKVDRSASYMARYLACNALDMFPEIDECYIQLAYAIGVSQPISVGIQTGNRAVNDYFGYRIRREYDLSPRGIIDFLHLTEKDYYLIAQGCHYRPNGVLKGVK